MASDGVTPDRTPADGADPKRCGCAGKTPLDAVVLPARDAIARRLAGTEARLAPDRDAAVVPGAIHVDREVEEIRLDGSRPAVPFESADRQRGDTGDSVVTLACALLGDDLADATALGRVLGDAYAALAPGDGPRVTVGKGHAIQVSESTGGRLWLEHLAVPRPRDCRDGDDPAGGGSERFLAANVDAVHAFPDLTPTEQARVAVSNALADVYAVGATTDRRVRPVVWAPAGATPSRDTVEGWYRSGAPDGVGLLDPTVSAHDGDGWVIGGAVTAVGAGDGTEHPLPDDCGVLLTRPPGGLAAFALGTIRGDDRLRERGRRHLLRDASRVAEVLASFRAGHGEAFDPAEHVARVTDVSGEGLAGVGRLVGAEGRTLRLERLPVLSALAVATDEWTVPDVTVETNGPFAVFATPAVLDRVAAKLVGVDGADPRRIGTVIDPGREPTPGETRSAEVSPIVDATGEDLSWLIEAAARWPSVSPSGDTQSSDGAGGER